MTSLSFAKKLFIKPAPGGEATFHENCLKKAIESSANKEVKCGACLFR